MSEEPKKEVKNEIKINKNKSNKNKTQIEFDMFKVLSTIKKEGSYKQDNCIFELYKGYKPSEYEESDDTPKYFVDIKNAQCNYIGILSKNLNKELYGYSLYDNGDEYFGQWNSDSKEGFGIYYFKEKEKDESKIYHIYIGEFQDNKKSGEGKKKKMCLLISCSKWDIFLKIISKVVLYIVSKTKKEKFIKEN